MPDIKLGDEIEDVTVGLRGYAVKVGDGVYAPKRQPMGFVARQEAQS